MTAQYLEYIKAIGALASETHQGQGYKPKQSPNVRLQTYLIAFSD
jgi:hypothetical protein